MSRAVETAFPPRPRNQLQTTALNNLTKMIVHLAKPFLMIFFLFSSFTRLKTSFADASSAPTMSPTLDLQSIWPNYFDTNDTNYPNYTFDESLLMGEQEEHWLLNGTLEEGALLLGDFENETVTALRAMYESFEMNATGLDWLNESIPVCEWEGIGCNETEHIKVIALDSSSLRGTIPEEITMLSTLEVLALGMNDIHGSIPESIALLTDLKAFGVQWNNITGPIPTTIGNLMHLEVLDLWENAFSGTIPTEFGRLGNLDYFDLDGNNIHGSIPSEFGELSNLTTAYLDSNEISGSIPSTIKNLTKLNTLSMTFNEITGTIPSEVGELTELLNLDLSFNEISGTIPSTIGNLRNLSYLALNDNNLTGTIPTETGLLGKLMWILFFNNELSGSIPSEIGGIDMLLLVSMENNKISGSIPSELGRWNHTVTFMYDLEIDCCDVSQDKNQSVCGTCCQCSERRSLQNFFHETVGENWVDSENWLRVDAPHCNISGYPSWSGIGCNEEMHVTAIDMDHNNLAGPIPSSVGALHDLRRLVLSRNVLNGTIPPELFELEHLTQLHLHQNMLTGELPSAVAQLSKMNQLDISSNELGGSLSGLTKLQDLSALSIWDNNFSGGLPPEFALLTNIKKFRVDRDITCCKSEDELCDSCCVCEKRSKERNILVTLFNATDGPGWFNSNGRWNADSTYHCDWHGVSCNENDEVIRINLVKNNLHGTIPRVLGELEHLKKLSLSENIHLSGSIPSELGLATNLRSLELHLNTLDGTVPSQLGSLGQLTGIKLNGNLLTGSYPSSMSNLTNLTTIYLDTRIKCCDSLCFEQDFCCLCQRQTEEHSVLKELYVSMAGENWTNSDGWGDETRHHCTWHGIYCEKNGLIKEIHLAKNNVRGTMLPRLDLLTSLTDLLMHDNQITGYIPSQLGKLTLLKTIELEGNNLKGTLPSELMSLAALESLSLSGVELQGPIPLQVFSMTKLTSLALTNTRLIQNIPTHISGLVNLVSLRLDGNEMKGRVPKELGNLIELTRLSLSNNQLKKLPSSIGQLKSLEELDLESNRFAQDERSELRKGVPSFLGELNQLRSLTLSGNFFNGELPMSFIKLTNLARFRLDDSVACCSLYQPQNACVICRNVFTERDILMQFYKDNGGISWKKSWKIKADNSSHFATHHCLLDGVSCGSGSFVQEIILESNGLVGSIPREVGDLTHLSVLRLGGNQLSSNIPTEIEKLSQLQVMDMRANQLTGRVPYGLSKLLELQKLFLRGNLLSGAMPVFLSGNLKNMYVDENVECCDTAATQCTFCKIQKEQAKERDVLWDLFKSTNGQGWKNSSNWARYDVDPCDKVGGWHGVVCDGEGFVVEVHLPENNLIGRLPENIGTLRNLRELNVSSNQLPVRKSAGTLEMVRLRNIFTLTNGESWKIKGNFNDMNVDHCKWDGVTCNSDGRVVKLDLSSRGLSGAIPAEDIGSLTELEELKLHSNELNGEVPPHLAALKKLKHLSLSHNELEGSIPFEFTDLSSLDVFLLHRNNLEGALPTFPQPLTKYISDCGEPSDITLECISCTVCCNSLGTCQEVAFQDRALWELTGFVLGGVFLCLLVINLVGMFLMRMKTSSVRKPMPNASFLLKESVYTFLLSKRPAWWFAAFVAVFLQSATFALFVHAASDVSSDDSDWVYTWTCPRDKEYCIHDDPRTWVGWSILVLVMVASLAPDIIDVVRLFMLSIGRVDLHCLVLGLCITWTTSVAVWTTVVYNYAIATTNTVLIINAVILLFVNDLDEMIFTIMEHLFPSRVENIFNNVRRRLQEKHCISFGEGYDEVPRDIIRHVSTTENMPVYTQQYVLDADTVDDDNEHNSSLDCSKGEDKMLQASCEAGKEIRNKSPGTDDKYSNTCDALPSEAQKYQQYRETLQEQSQKIEMLFKTCDDLRDLVIKQDDLFQKQDDQIQHQNDQMQHQDDELKKLKEELKGAFEHLSLPSRIPEA